MRRQQRNFAETGAASSIVALLEKGIGLGYSSQAELVPIQKQVIAAELARQSKEQEEEMEQSRTSNQTPNAAARSHQSSLDETETVRYVNKSENPDYE